MKNKNFLNKIILAVFIILIILPICVILVWSFTNNYKWPEILSVNFSLRGWINVIENSNRIFSSLKSSLIISLFTTIITVIIAIPCAEALVFYEFKGKRLVEILIFSPVVIPMVAISMGLNTQFMKWHIARTYFGIILVMIVPCIPYAVSLLKEVLNIVGDKYIKIATTLGAKRHYIAFKVMIPMIIPGIISASIITFIISFSEYFIVYLIGGGKIITFTMEMFPFVKSGERIFASVYSVIFIIIVSCLLIIMQKIIRKLYKSSLLNYNLM